MITPVGYNLTGLLYNNVFGQVDPENGLKVRLLLKYQDMQSRLPLYSALMTSKVMVYAKTGDEVSKEGIDNLIGKMYPPYRWEHYKEDMFKKYLEKLSSGGTKSVKEMKAILRGKEDIREKRGD